jgi:hypothetical protein
MRAKVLLIAALILLAGSVFNPDRSAAQGISFGAKFGLNLATRCH